MLLILALSAGGLVAGLFLLWVVPVISAQAAIKSLPKVTVIIPARNEEENLPTLLRSVIDCEERPAEVLVVDDQSTDRTSLVAEKYGARVLSSRPLPPGWTGKAWACYQGAIAGQSEVLCFLDADTKLAPGGYGRLIREFACLPPEAVLSILPFHVTRLWYEELSLVFNVVLAMAAGGFGPIHSPHLFGQSLVIRKQLYFRAGGHQAVREQILENLNLTTAIQAAGGVVYTRGGRGALTMRMYPGGLAELCAGWRKAFALGARVTSPRVLALSIYWLWSLAMLTLSLSFGSNWRLEALALYCIAVAQIMWFARQVGSFRMITAVLFPVPLLFYFALFGQSAWQRARRKPVLWRGRAV